MNNFSLPSGPGIVSLPTQRFEKQFNLFEYELDTLSNFNHAATVFFSIGAFVGAFPIEKIIEKFNFADSISIWKFFKCAEWICVLLSLICYGFGGFYVLRRGALTKKIKKKSYMVTKNPHE